MIESVLVATDLADGSDDVMRAAAALAKATDARLHVLHAFPFEPNPYSSQSSPPTFQGRIAEADRALDEQITRAAGRAVKLGSREVVLHIAFKAIRDRARAVDADVVVLGPHRKHAVADRFLGGTADRVIRSVDVPALIVRSSLALPLRRVVVPLDLSAPALGALDVAFNWCDALGSATQPPELIILHIIPRVYDFADVPIDLTTIRAELTQHVSAARSRLADGHPPDVREEVRWADETIDGILSFVQEVEADLIVLGTHGHGAIKRALIGSVAAGVARAATGPVLLVPPSLAETE